MIKSSPSRPVHVSFAGSESLSAPSPCDRRYRLRVLRADLPPYKSSASLLVVGSAYLGYSPRNSQGFPSSWRFSPRIPRSLWTPADPRVPHQFGTVAWASGTLTPSPSALTALTGLYQALGSAVPLRSTWFPVYALDASFGSSPPPHPQHSVRVVG